jgi:redox-sensitive bicupin YhaK (pirin superfamily)
MSRQYTSEETEKMIQITKSNQRYHFETDWLSTYWHFSFDHYYDPANISFGPLRVFNDDVVQPGGGFPMHSHREMEIVTIPLSGQLEHRDSEGNHGVIAPNEVQRMSAGTGISHSEFNPSKEDPVHFLQVWVQPAVRGLKPSWEQKTFSPELRRGVLLPIATGQEELLKAKNGALRIHQDATFYLSTLPAGKKLEHELGAGRRAYVFVTDGELTLNRQNLKKGDVAKVTEQAHLAFEAGRPSEFLLTDLP